MRGHWKGPIEGAHEEHGFGPGSHRGPFGGGGRGGPRHGGFGGPGFGPGFKGRGRGGRAQRGDVRLAILLLLNEEPMHGYQIMSAIEERTEGAWKPSPGAVYPSIAALEDEGYVTVTEDSGRKLVSITDEGRAHLTETHDAEDDPFAAIREEGGHHELRHSVMQFGDAVRAVAMSGDDAQLKEALKIVDKAKRSLYLLLAGDDETPAE